MKKAKSNASGLRTPAPTTLTPCSPAATKMVNETVMADLIFRTDYLDCPESRVLFGQCSISPPDRRRTKVGQFAQSPWSDGYIHPKPDNDLMVALMDWCTDAGPQYMNIKWLTVELPRFITLTGSHVRDQLVHSHMLDFEMCDLLVRRLTQLDKHDVQLQNALASYAGK